MCRYLDMRNKEVIDVYDGKRLGFVCDIAIDLVSGKIISIIIPGARGFWHFFGKVDDYIIPWANIKKIGDDIIIVDTRI